MEAVLGVGAVPLATPPTDTVNHERLVPVAVNAVAVAPRQYVTGLVTVGAVGNGLMVTSILDRKLSQPPEVWVT